MSYLKQYVVERNALNKMFKRPTLTINSPKDRATIRQLLECDLSPENLCCDGELRGAPLRAKSRKLFGALDELNKMEGK